MKYDFGGYATRNNLKCSDGRTIRKDAFKDCDGQTVPLVWQHQRNTPDNVLGHALLENRPDGVYCYCNFNDTDAGQNSKSLVEHGDIRALSIHANQLKQNGGDVIHGIIREVSLVYAGANPGAYIDNLSIEHSDGSWDEIEDEAIIYTGRSIDIGVMHGETPDPDPEPTDNDQNSSVSHADTAKSDGGDSNKTIQEIFDSLTEEQKTAVYAVIGYAISGDEDEDGDDAEHSEEGTEMKKNVFEGAETPDNTLSHDEMTSIFADAKRCGSLKDSCLQHGITDIDMLFPEAKTLRTTPDLITRPMDWVSRVWGGVKKSPFSRIKSMAANLTADEARAKGYIKGKKKTEEQFGLLKRSTTPQTIYKKQKLDRDDIIDITDFDVVAWLKAEMRMMLNEELARAILIGDGRPSSSDDKINPLNIRPVYYDDDMYTIHYKVDVPTNGDRTDQTNAIIDAAHLARIDYRGSGTPVFLTNSKTLTTMLLSRDKIGHRLYNTVGELASALRVSDIIEVPVLENVTRDVKGTTMNLVGLILNLNDYTVGADRGGQISMFDDFDIDYNQYKYLMETRCSGALTLPYSAIALETVSTTASDTDTGTDNDDDTDTGTVG